MLELISNYMKQDILKLYIKSKCFFLNLKLHSEYMYTILIRKLNKQRLQCRCQRSLRLIGGLLQRPKSSS